MRDGRRKSFFRRRRCLFDGRFAKSISVETSSGDAKVRVQIDSSFRLEADTRWEKAKVDLPLAIRKARRGKGTGGRSEPSGGVGATFESQNFLPALLSLAKLPTKRRYDLQ